MDYQPLLGNDRLLENLKQSLSQGRISHFYLICGPAGSGKHTLARFLTAAILCQKPNGPCLQCPACRKVLDGMHPDVISVVDPDHKNVAVRIVREMREDVFIRPNEAEHKIYIFPQELGLEGQNALLKILEEPPKYGVFLLLTDNPDKLLPTVRSRCVELRLQPLPKTVMEPRLRREFPEAAPEDLSAAMERSGGFLGQARELLKNGQDVPPQTEEFVRCFAARDTLGLTRTLVPMEKWKRDAWTEILDRWSEILEGALACRSGSTGVMAFSRQLSASRTAQELRNALSAVRRAREYLQNNVSPAAVSGYLVWALR